MVTVTKRFLDLTASDLMSHEVVTLPLDMPLRAAAERLAAAGISGAPVVDAEGRCVGVLSKSDLVRSMGPEVAPPPKPAEGPPSSYFADWQVVDLQLLPADGVGRHMSGDVISAYPDTPVRELARLMSAFHIHRLIITDIEMRVVGVVSALDLVGAMAATAEERP